MKNLKIKLVSVCIVTSLFYNPHDLFGERPTIGPVRTSLSKMTFQDFVFFDANRIGTWITNVGELVSFRKTGNAGMEWPVGSGNTINFQSGLWIGGMVGTQIRTAAAEYTVEFSPGPFEDWMNGDDLKYKIYTITRNDMIDTPGDDYLDWPFEDGAPMHLDENGNIVLDDDGNMIPGLIGDMLSWSVFSDADPTAHSNLFNTPPLGVEVQQTIWGFNESGVFGDMIFMKYIIINKGGSQIDDTYLSFWADIDLGVAADDLVGADTVLSLGYNYNDGADNIYGAAPPAIGYDFFQGPIVESPGDTAKVSRNFRSSGIVPGFRNLPMTSLAVFQGGGPAGSGDPQVPQEMYFFQQGLDGLGGEKTDPTTGLVTKFSYPGDPVRGEGWNRIESGDLRFMLSTGPFTLAPGDTQELVGGIVIAQGNNALNSITALKAADAFAQQLYDNDFKTHMVNLLSPSGGDTISGTFNITWDAESYSGEPLLINLYSKPTDDDSLHLIADDLENDGSYDWDTRLMSDGFYNIFIEAFDASGTALDLSGQDQTSMPVIINNPGNGAPEEPSILSPIREIVNGRQLVKWSARDPDGDQLFIDLQVSPDEGNSWETFAEGLENIGSYQWESFVYPNSDNSLLRAVSSDGFVKVPGEPVSISLVNERPLSISRERFTQLSGVGNGLIRADIIEPSALTGHSYRITFNDSLVPGELRYSVSDVDLDEIVVDNSDRISAIESPLFDGIRTYMLNYETLEMQRFEWTTVIGDTSTYELNIDRLRTGRAADYEVRFLGGVADTSLLGSKTFPFQIWNITDDPPSKVGLFALGDTWESGDPILFVEPPIFSPGNFSWSIFFEWDDSSISWEIGEVLTIYTDRPYTSEDVLEFDISADALAAPNLLMAIAQNPAFPKFAELVITPTTPVAAPPSVTATFDTILQSIPMEKIAQQTYRGSFEVYGTGLLTFTAIGDIGVKDTTVVHTVSTALYKPSAGLSLSSQNDDIHLWLSPDLSRDEWSLILAETDAAGNLETNESLNIGQLFEIIPSKQLSKPGRLSVRIPEGSDPEELSLFQLKPDGWTPLETTFSQRGKLLQAEVYSLGRFKLDKGTSIETLPLTFNLSQNYPNPFNPSTTIEYSLPEISRVKIRIFDLLGHLVKEFDTGFNPPGSYSVRWDGVNSNGHSVATGLYIYELTALNLSGSENYRNVKKMVLIK